MGALASVSHHQPSVDAHSCVHDTQLTKSPICAREAIATACVASLPTCRRCCCHHHCAAAAATTGAAAGAAAAGAGAVQAVCGVPQARDALPEQDGGPEGPGSRQQHRPRGGRGPKRAGRSRPRLYGKPNTKGAARCVPACAHLQLYMC